MKSLRQIQTASGAYREELPYFSGHFKYFNHTDQMKNVPIVPNGQFTPAAVDNMHDEFGVSCIFLLILKCPFHWYTVNLNSLDYMTFFQPVAVVFVVFSKMKIFIPVYWCHKSSLYPKRLLSHIPERSFWHCFYGCACFHSNKHIDYFMSIFLQVLITVHLNAFWLQLIRTFSPLHLLLDIDGSVPSFCALIMHWKFLIQCHKLQQPQLLFYYPMAAS